MDSFEDWKTELVADLLWHMQPMKSVTHQTGYKCQPTRMADKSHYHIHYIIYNYLLLSLVKTAISQWRH